MAEAQPVVAAPPARIAVVIPCLNEEAHIGTVLAAFDATVWRIYCVDDGSTDGTAAAILAAQSRDQRIHLIRREASGGMGAAIMDGHRRAMADDADIVVKMDGDGQMDPGLIPDLVRPIVAQRADYVKGNRFFQLENLEQMPLVRMVGNAGLSFLTKLSTGYWNLFDATNGYTAVHVNVLRELPFDKLAPGYFFETDIIFRLSTLRAVVAEIPMRSRYGDEVSKMSVTRELFRFSWLHLKNFGKRIFYNYFLRNFSIASVYLVMSLPLLFGGISFGLVRFIAGARSGEFQSAGTVMFAALPILLGGQLLLGFMAYDMASTPTMPIHPYLGRRK